LNFSKLFFRWCTNWIRWTCCRFFHFVIQHLMQSYIKELDKKTYRGAGFWKKTGFRIRFSYPFSRYEYGYAVFIFLENGYKNENGKFGNLVQEIPSTPPRIKGRAIFESRPSTTTFFLSPVQFFPRFSQCLPFKITKKLSPVHSRPSCPAP